MDMAKNERRAIQTVAAFEAFKGILVLLVTSGALMFHQDIHKLALELFSHLHLNPAAKYPSAILDFFNHAQGGELKFVVTGAVTYSAMRFAEAYGLFIEAAWAEILAAVSGAIYIPFELIEVNKGADYFNVAALVINIAVVGLMTHALMRRRKRKA